MLRESLQLPYSEFPLILHTHLCAGPESGNRGDDTGQNNVMLNPKLPVVAQTRLFSITWNRTQISSAWNSNLVVLALLKPSRKATQQQLVVTPAACCETSDQFIESNYETSDQFMESRSASAASNAAMESQTSKSEASYQSIECESGSAASNVNIKSKTAIPEFVDQSIECRSVSAASIVTIQSANSEPSDQSIECVCRSVSATSNLSIKYQSTSSERPTKLVNSARQVLILVKLSKLFSPKL